MYRKIGCITGEDAANIALGFFAVLQVACQTASYCICVLCTLVVYIIYNFIWILHTYNSANCQTLSFQFRVYRVRCLLWLSMSFCVMIIIFKYLFAFNVIFISLSPRRNKCHLWHIFQNFTSYFSFKVTATLLLYCCQG